MRTILVIAHPGHELRVHGWLETTRPEVWVLTDGSGHTGRSRIASTTRVLAAAGAAPGPVYGQMTDVDLYNAVLNLEHRPFTSIVDQLAQAVLRDDVECIAGDAEEGYNPAHDICRLVINAATDLVELRTDKRIPSYDFTLVGAPQRGADEHRAHALWLDLDDAAFARKLSAAHNYPELQAEVESALSVTDAANFRLEYLRLVDSHTRAPFAGRPFYEEYGERQVQAGHYSHVLRYREHMLPLAAALTAHVRRNS